MPYLNTPRLSLRNFQANDLEPLYEYRNHPDCYRFQRWEDSSREFLAGYIQSYQADQFPPRGAEQHYAIADRENRLVGDVSCFVKPEDGCLTLGITLSHRRHRRGYAREILTALIPLLRETHPQLDLVALIDPENIASISLFEQLGFQRECYAESIHSYVYVIGRKDHETPIY